MNYVVVLGGGYTGIRRAPSSNLINNSLPRLTEGIRLWQANPGSKMILPARRRNEPRQHGGSRGESGGEPWRTSQRYHCARSAERYRRGSAGGEARHRRRALPAGHLGVTPSAGDDILSPCRPDPLPAPANQLAVTSPLNPWSGPFLLSVADAQRPGRL